ncbi:30S ribosomal protein S11 [Candidatus Pacearchaeota archaeon]|jgi:small subunit ribosomal protein S11|nr:30S ribosomal protein S11 [Candidatus Pacearchaeota archaeon]|tara:strand:+ start:496 stop:1032 length:537 start_codon:yes stop_codon:yes gene_type:complete
MADKEEAKVEEQEDVQEEVKEKSSEEKMDNKIESKDKEDRKDERKDIRDVKKKKEERIGILNIYTTFNNTIMNLTDMSGKSLAKFSGGQSTKQDRLKANPTIAMFIAQKIVEEAQDNGITGFYVKIRASTGQNNPGPGTHAAIKSLTRAGFKILSIMETTRIPRGGPKKKGGRRGRRV